MANALNKNVNFFVFWFFSQYLCLCLSFSSFSALTENYVSLSFMSVFLLNYILSQTKMVTPVYLNRLFSYILRRLSLSASVFLINIFICSLLLFSSFGFDYSIKNPIHLMFDTYLNRLNYISLVVRTLKHFDLFYLSFIFLFLQRTLC
jgi:hypothetical protein